MKKRILTLSLALAMALTFSIPALAADGSLTMVEPQGPLDDKGIEVTKPLYDNGIATFDVIIHYTGGNVNTCLLIWTGAEGDIGNSETKTTTTGNPRKATTTFNITQVEDAQTITFTVALTTNQGPMSQSVEVFIAALGEEDDEDNNNTLEEEDKEPIIEPDVHVCDDGDYAVTANPTCTVEGAWEIRCEICDDVLESGEIGALGHTPGDRVDTLDPTCTVEGAWEIRCEICDDVLESGAIGALGHTPGERVDTLAPTCTAEGAWEIRCEVCDDVLESGEIGALGHKYNPVSARASNTNLQNNTTVTITVDGKCSVCGDMTILASATVKLKQNGTQIVKIGEYEVTVVVNDNNKITNIFVGAPAASAGNAQNNNSQGGNGNSQR